LGGMKFLAYFFKSNKKKLRKTLSDYKQDMLVRQGRQQFKKLKDLGLEVPVVLL